MLPVDRGEHATVVATWRWMWLAIASTFIPVVAGEVGYVYVVGVVVANAFLVRRMWALVAADRNVADGGVLVGGPESAGRIAARRAFLGSMSWLAMIFVVFIVDALVS
jgi:heme O synthase-like polyprenyltransferase